MFNNVICDDLIASTGYSSMFPASSAKNAFASKASMLSFEYANGMYSLSFLLYLISERKILNSLTSVGEPFIIFFIAFFNSDDFNKSGATEKNRLLGGSVIIKIIKIIAE